MTCSAASGTQVQSLTAQTNHETGEIAVNRSFASEAVDTLVETFFVTVAPAIKQPLEHVIVELTITGLETDWTDYADNNIGSIMGDFSAWLTSPMGTVNELFFNDRDIPMADWETNRDYHDDEIGWQFLSNAYWGEDVEGLWTLEVVNDTDNALSGIWEDFAFHAAMGGLTLVPEPSGFALFLAIATLPLIARRRR